MGGSESGSMVSRVATERPLAGQRVAFTGRLAVMDRRQAKRLVQDAGGLAMEHLSRRTSLLVVGLQGWPVLPDGSISRKLEQAEKMVNQGHSLEIVSEEVFLQRLGLRPVRRTGLQTCSLQQAACILGTEEGRDSSLRAVRAGAY